MESIFHAAAYKHVPMMESHVLEAVRNNVLGTWNLVQATRGQKVRTLLMISSDKAVNPICVMGATKRACERIVSARCPGTSKPNVSRCVLETSWEATEAWSRFFKRRSPPAGPSR